MSSPRDSPAAKSVLQRLLNHSRQTGEDYDLWVLIRDFEMEDAELAAAVRATFQRRNTPIPTELPVALSEDFAADAMKQSQWKGFLRRSGLPDDVTLVEVVRRLRDRLAPLLGLGR